MLWIDAGLYNIDLRTSSPAEDARLKLQKPIEEKFKLRFHREVRDMPVYLLIAAEGGPKLHPVDTSANSAPNGQRDPVGYASEVIFAGSGFFAGALPLNQLAKPLSLMLNRQAIDRTGLVGLFDINIKWSEDANRPEPDTNSRSQTEPELVHPIIFKALPEQLGLKLKPDKGLGEFFVIDSVEKPSEN